MEVLQTQIQRGDLRRLLTTNRTCGYVFGSVGFALLVLSAVWWSGFFAVQSFVEVPAKIVHLGWEETPHPDGALYRLVCRYEYSFGGRAFLGDDVYLGADDLAGASSPADFERLRESESTGRQIPAFVDPADPTRAVLFHTVDLPMILSLLAGVLFVIAAMGAFVGASRVADTLRYSSTAPRPWEQVQTWSDRRVPASNRALLRWSFFAVALLGGMFAFALSVVLTDRRSGIDPVFLPAILGPALAVALVVFGFFASRQIRFGSAQLRLNQVPIRVGESLAAVLEVPRGLRRVRQVEARLICASRNVILKRTEQVFARSERFAVPPAANGSWSIPIRMTVPDEHPGRDSTGLTHIRWTLSVRAVDALPGHLGAFEVPIYDPEFPRALLDAALDEDHERGMQWLTAHPDEAPHPLAYVHLADRLIDDEVEDRRRDAFALLEFATTVFPEDAAIQSHKSSAWGALGPEHRRQLRRSRELDP